MPSNQQPKLTDNEARVLTTRIKACTSWQQLQTLCERHGRVFNHINLSATITHIAQLHHAGALSAGSAGGDHQASTSYAPSPPKSGLPAGAAQLMDRLLSAAETQMSGFSTRQLANMMWAVAKSGHRPKPSWQQAAVAAAGRQWGQFEAQHVANMAYALALVGHDPGGPWLEGLLQVRHPCMHAMARGDLIGAWLASPRAC